MLYLMVHMHIIISYFDGCQFPNLVIWFPVVFDRRRSDAMVILLTLRIMVSTYVPVHGSFRAHRVGPISSLLSVVACAHPSLPGYVNIPSG